MNEQDFNRIDESFNRTLAGGKGTHASMPGLNYSPSDYEYSDKLMEYVNNQAELDNNYNKLRSLYNGFVVQLGRGIQGSLEAALDTNYERIRKANPEWQETEQAKTTRAIVNSMKNASWLKRYEVGSTGKLDSFGNALAEGAGQLASQALIGWATGGVGSALTMGASILGNQYEDLREQGVDVETAANAGLTNAIIQTPLERLSLTKLFKAIPIKNTSLRKQAMGALEKAFTEGATEFVQQYPEEITNLMALNKDLSNEELMDLAMSKQGEWFLNALESGVIGSILGGAGGAINLGFQKVGHDQSIENIKQAAAIAQKKGVELKDVAGVINANLGGEFVEVDAEALQMYFQESSNPEEAAKILGVTEDEVAKAAERGESIDIMRGEYTAMQTKDNTFVDKVQEYTSFDNSGYSPANEKRRKELAKQYEKQAQDKVDADEAFTSQLDELQAQMISGGAQKQVANQYRKIIAAYARAQNPYDPGKVLRKNPLIFTSVDRNGRPLFQSAVDTTTDNFKAWFKDSYVVDDNGKPLVVYHGTSSEFSSFDYGEGKSLGFFTSTKKLAEDFAENVADLKRTKPYVMPVYLSMQNPFVVYADGRYWDDILINKDVMEGYEYKDVDGEKVSTTTDEIVKAIRERYSRVFDGVVFKGVAGENDFMFSGLVDDYVPFEATQIKSAVANNGDYNPEDANIYHQSAGANAITADTEALSKAKELEMDGSSRDEIFNKTGWWRGDDGKWRFYIPDNLNKFNVQAIKDNANAGVDVKLMQVYDNPELFAAYPWLGNYTIKAIDNEKADYRGYVQNGDSSIHLNLNRAIPSDISKTLVHEIQHLIQMYEGFATGGNSSSVLLQMSQEEGKSFVEYDDKNEQIYNNYYNDYLFFATKYFDALEKNNDELADKYDVKMCEAYDRAEAFAIDSGISESRRLEIQEDIDWRKKLSDRVKKQLEDIQNDVALAISQEMEDEIYHNAYTMLHGEMEARNASDLADTETEIYKANEEKAAGEVAYNSNPEIKELVDEFANRKYNEPVDVLRAWSKELRPKLENEKYGLSYKLGVTPSAELHEKLVTLAGLQKKFRSMVKANQPELGIDKYVREVPKPWEGIGANSIIVFGKPLELASQYFQETEEQRDLVVYQNTQEEALLRAMDSGGMSVPSIAITKKDIPFDNFGSITLIGNKDIIDPEKGADVYSRDAYTVRTPSPEYKKATLKSLKEFAKKWAGKLSEDSINEIRHYAGNYPNQFVDALRSNDKVKYDYITKILGKDFEPVYEKDVYKQNNNNIEIDGKLVGDMIADILKENPKEIPYRMVDVVKAIYNKQIKDIKLDIQALDGDIALDQEIIDRGSANQEFLDRTNSDLRRLQRRKMLKERIIRQYERSLDEEITKDSDGREITYGHDNLIQDVKRKQSAEAEQTIDWTETGYKLTREFSFNELGLTDWLSKIMVETNGEPVLKLGGKYVPYTIENITQYMLKKRGAGAEQGMGMTASVMAAIGAKKLKSIDEIKSMNDKLRASDEMEKIIEELESKEQDLALRVAEEKGWDNWGLYNTFNEAFAIAIKGGKKATIANMKKALIVADGLDDFPQKYLKEVVDLANEYRDCATWYFEAKPQRTVKINEYSGAVVPKNTSINTIQRLEDEGLTVMEYDPSVPGDRQRVTEQVASSTNAYFQENKGKVAKGGISFDNAGNSIVALFEGADASTVIHETGHYFVETLIRDVLSGECTEQQKIDANALMNYCGIDLYTWQRLDFEGRRPHHEKLAEAFETYIMEGKAPSRELRDVFKKFAEWIKNVYKNLARNQNAVPITDEVRKVFDHLLATDEEIAQMEKVNGYLAKMPKAFTDRLSDRAKKQLEDAVLKAHDKAVEILTKQAMVNFSVERKQQIKDYRSSITDPITDEVMWLPLYAASRDVEAELKHRKRMAKSLAKKYLEHQDIEFENWQAELEYVNTALDEYFKPLLDEMENTGEQGVEIIYQDDYNANDESTTRGYKASRNSEWYRKWYADHGAPPSKADKWQIAYDNLTKHYPDYALDSTKYNETNYGGDEHYDEYLLDTKEDIDELIAKKKELEQDKDKVKLGLKKGLSPEEREKFDTIAEAYGFSSGDELAQQITDSPTESQEVRNRINAAVQEKFPDIMAERQLAAEKARESFYNDETGVTIALEHVLIEEAKAEADAKSRSDEAKRRLTELTKAQKDEERKAEQSIKEQEKKAQREAEKAEKDAKTLERKRRAAIILQNAQVSAKKDIAAMSMREAMRVRKFITAERNAASKAAVALSKKNYDDALQYKGVQMYNHILVSESLKAKTTYQKGSKVIKALAKNLRVKNLDKLHEKWFDEDNYNQAAALFVRMGMPLKGYDPLSRTETLSDYLARMQELYDNVDIAEWLLDEAPIGKPADLSLTQYEDVIDAIRNINAIVKAAKGEDALVKGQEYSETKQEIIDLLSKKKDKWSPDVSDVERANPAEQYLANMQNTDDFFEKMDGWEYGFFSKLFTEKVTDAMDREFFMMRDFQNKLGEARDRWYGVDRGEGLVDKAKYEYAVRQAEKMMDEKIYYKDLGCSVDKNILVKMLMYLGSESSSNKLCSNKAGSTYDAFFKNSTLWTDDVETTRENLLEFLGNNLTKNDIRYAQDMIDAIGMFWWDLSNLDRRTKGFRPKKVEALPAELILKDGSKVAFMGGYVPLIRRHDTGSTYKGADIVDMSNATRGAGVKTMHTNTGSSKARDGSVYPLDLRKGIELNSVRETVHDICFREVVAGYRKMINDKEIYYLMKQKLGIADMNVFEEFLKKVAKPYGSKYDTIAENNAGEFMQWVRARTVNTAIVFNFKTMAQNISNIALYGNSVEGFEYKDVYYAYRYFFNNISAKEQYGIMEFIKQKSAFMSERMETVDITIRDIQEGTLNVSPIEKMVAECGAKMMVFTDNLSAVPVWYQAFAKKISQGATEREAVMFADTVIRRTLGSSRVTDVAAVQRGGAFYKLFTVFQSFFITQYNQALREGHKDVKLWSEGKKGEAARNAFAYLLSKWLIACLMNVLLGLEDPFEESSPEARLGKTNIAKELIHYPIGMFAVIGPIANPIVDTALKIKGFGYRGTPLDGLYNTVERSFKKLDKGVTDGDYEGGLEGLTSLGGFYYGVPSQFNKIFWNGYDAVFNGMELSWGDLLRRRPAKER